MTYDRNFFKHHPEISILHINDCSAANLRLMKTAKKYGVQTRILHSHNSNYLKPLKKRQLLVEQWNKKHLGEIATDLFACSNDAGKFMFGNEPFTVVKNAVETEKFLFDAKKRKRCRTVLGVSDEQTVIGCVARFDVQKNHTFLIDIFSEYKKRDNTAILVLVGEGVLRTEVEEKINQLGLTDSVMMLGMRDDVPDLLNAFDIFVLPSLSEGLSLVMIEGQINGLNFVVSDQVPTETNILGKMDFVSLHESASIWAQKIAHMVEKKNRSIDIEVVRRAGYDISIESKKLQEFYLSRVK